VIDVGSVKMTSEGPIRETNTIVSSIRRSKWSDEQMETLQSYIRKYPNCPPSRLVFDLKQKEGIQISVAALRKIRESLDFTCLKDQ
jgi:transposase